MALIAGAGVFLLLALIMGAIAYEQVPEGNEGVTTQWGAVTGETLNSGAHFKIPIMQDVQTVETRPRTYTMSNSIGEGKKKEADAITVKTINGSSVDVDVTVRYRINASEADEFVTDWNNEEQMEQRLIRPTIRSDLRDEASDIQTSTIYTQEGREALQETAKESLEAEFANEPIVLEEVQIRNIDLPDSIDQALDEKEEAKQRVQVEREKVKQERAKKEQQIVQAEADKEAQIIEAEGDAEAIEIKGEALEGNEVVLEQRYIEALKEGNTIYVPTGDGSGLALTRETSEDEDDDSPSPDE